MAKNQECALKLTDIVKTYGEGNTAVKALKGINLSFRKNEFVSILGPSGCGKTTLLNIIGGLDRYSSGDLKISGKSTKNYKDRDWDAYRNNSIGFVFQSYNLIPHQTILANVELSLALSGISKSERKKRAEAVLEKVGLGGLGYKKPNQLSGGQMQRVAIARALVNDPEIILADEPTGALDTETSIQVMNLLKEVAKDRLVIMVTHNPDLAETYSTRIIRLLDGLVMDDTNPFKGDTANTVKEGRKTRMGFGTAFGLSIKNLFSKKARTVLTSIAGSIGIIGVALVLAISTGFNMYMARMQTDTLSSYPLTISESSVDLSSFMETGGNDIIGKYSKLNNVVVKEAFNKLTGMLKKNDLSEEFLNYLNDTPKDDYYAIQYSYGFDMNDYFYTDIKYNGEEKFTAIDSFVNDIENEYESTLIGAMGLSTSFVRQYIPTIQEMPESYDLISEQYTAIYGNLPTFEEDDYDKIYLVVDENNSVSDITLALLGFISVSIDNEGNPTFETLNGLGRKDVDGNIIFDMADIIENKGLYLATNDLMFEYDNEIKYFRTKTVSKETAGLKELKIAGILREKENVEGVLDLGIAYSPALTRYVIEKNKDSEIVNYLNNQIERAKTMFPEDKKMQTMASYIQVIIGEQENAETGQMEKTLEAHNLRTLAGDESPANISIYARSFEGKQRIKNRLDAWNDRFEEGDSKIIAYADMMSMVFGVLTTMVDAVTYVLVAFSSISLIVSSVMIGIITYTSVVERTKEIGVLRALGASKREVSRVFNAETFLIGLFAGLIGVGITYLLSIPINIILASAVSGIGKIAVLKPITALILIVVSICLTLIAGLIPARIAAKKDPVVALRSE